MGIACVASASDEWQYWNEFVTERELGSRWSLEVAVEQNLFDDFDEFGMWNVQVRPFYEVGGLLSLGLEYRYERERDEGSWATEHRYSFIPVLKHEWREWEFKLKTMVEYRDKEGDDEWRWREKLKIGYPCRCAGLSFTPWVAEDVFYMFDAGQILQNRASVGLSTEITGWLEATLYYLNRQDKKGVGWVHTHVLGTEFVVKW